jgi:O-antigen/teichoic acid export membrane protein
MDERIVKTVAKGGGIALFALLFSKAFAFVYRILLARFLEPADYGLLFLGIAVITSVRLLFIQGFPEGLNRFVAFFRGKKDPARVRGVIVDCFLVVGVLSVISGLALFFFSDWIAEELFNSPGLSVLLKVLAISMPFQGFYFAYESIARGFNRLEYWAYAELFGRHLGELLIGVFLVVLGFGAFGASVGFFLSFVLGVGILFFFVEKKLVSVFKKGEEVTRLTREFVSFSLPLFLAESILSLSQQSGTLLIGFFQPLEQVGVFNAVFSFMMVLTFFMVAMNKSFIPMASELFAQEKTRELESLFKATTKWIFMASLPVFIVFFLFSENLLRLFFGVEYLSFGASLALKILSVGYLINVSTGSVRWVLVSIGKTKTNFYNMLVFTVLNVGIGVALIPSQGVVGAAIALAIATAVINLLRLVEIRHFLGIHPYKLSYLRPLLAGVVSIAVVYGSLKLLFPVVNYLTAFVAVFVFFSFYALLVLVFKSFEEEEITVVKAFEKKFRLGNRISGIILRFYK